MTPHCLQNKIQTLMRYWRCSTIPIYCSLPSCLTSPWFKLSWITNCLHFPIDWEASHLHDCILIPIHGRSVYILVPSGYKLYPLLTFNWLNFNHSLRFNLMILISRKYSLNPNLFSAPCTYWLQLHISLLCLCGFSPIGASLMGLV